ncbi:ADP-ribose pyrophosphatase [Nocardioides baekrokdamisoli]|uniref:ADP-ribose pyrophosphatase n=1 Tax=Nocardioides baekrokdamisoli TaxID=1804624 RepID=A0A3G9J107_9ACTN|nr:NUDIX hydrolase [Nocardioides baekrokdamisoli]BBH17154.1 ADP-ribose pyrophosphatase [Nocardioides baekrokdamisoli]
MVIRARQIEAAGAVVLRDGIGGREVLLVHRPTYDDWSFPKGKVDRGEHVTACAIREVEEETGVRIRLSVPLRSQRYPVKGGVKTVHYWSGIVIDPDAPGAEAYVPNDEIDEATWWPIDKAARMLTYRYDRKTLREALRTRLATRTVIVLRHGESRSRGAWRTDDQLRPLLVAGRRQAERVAPVLEAYGTARVVSSSSTRCLETVVPYAERAGHPLEAIGMLSEEGFAPGGVAALVTKLVRQAKRQGPTVICSHRPVLPDVFAALGVADQKLAKGEMAVVHLRRGAVLAIERHLA